MDFNSNCSNATEKQQQAIANSNLPAGQCNSRLLPPRPPRKDRHRKVEGRDRRIRLSPTCAKRVLHLTQELGFRHPGQTIEWLLRQAAPAVNAVLSRSTPVSHLLVPPPPAADFRAPPAAPGPYGCASRMFFRPKEFMK